MNGMARPNDMDWTNDMDWMKGDRIGGEGASRTKV